MADNAIKKDNVKFLASMFHMEQSVCEQVLQENKDNVEDAVNHILTMLNEAKPQENSENNEMNDQVKQFEKEKLQQKEKQERLLRQQQEAMRQYEEERERERLRKEAEEIEKLRIIEEKKLAEQKKKELEDLAREEELLALELQQGEEQRKAIEEKLRLAQQHNKELIEQRLREEEEEEMRRAQQKSMSDRPSGGKSGKRRSSKTESQNNKSVEPKEKKNIEDIAPDVNVSNGSKKLKPNDGSPSNADQSVVKSAPKADEEISEPAMKEESKPKEEKNPEHVVEEPKQDVVQIEGAESDEFSLIPNDDELSSAQFGEELSLPLFSIYLRKSSLTKKNIDDTISMKKILAESGVPETDVKEVDPSNDIELTGFIKAKCRGQLKFPILFIRDEMIGGLEALQKIQQDGTLTERIARDKANQNTSPRSTKTSQDDITESQQSTQEISMGVLNTALEKAENVLSYLNPLNWFRGGKQTDKDESVIEFNVIHTNWYWRQQTRVLRLTKDHILRIHPKYGDVRAAQKYDEISKVVVKNKDYFILYYKESSPDYFRAPSNAIEKIVSTIKERAQKPDEIQVEYTTK